MAIAHWSNDIKLTREQLTTLHKLYNLAITEENSLNNQCKKLLNNPEIDTTHGAYIRQFFNQVFQPTNYDSEKVYNNYIETYAEELKKSLELNKDELLAYGIEPLLEDLHSVFDKNSKRNTKARGYYSELRMFEGLFNGLKSKFGDSAVITDTAPKDREGAIRYDINIMINKPDETLLDLNIENKTGITEPFTASSFDLGTFSSTGFSFKNSQKVYDSLIESLQKDFHKFLETANKETTEIDKWVKEQLVDWSIQYIYWRLNNNFPIFTSDRKGGKLNLSSEIIKGFATNPGGHVEYVLNDILKFVNLSATYSYNSWRQKARYVFDKNSPEVSILEEYIKDKDGWNWIEQDKFNGKKIWENTKISPSFKATVWYGNR